MKYQLFIPQNFKDRTPEQCAEKANEIYANWWKDNIKNKPTSKLENALIVFVLISFIIGTLVGMYIMTLPVGG